MARRNSRLSGTDVLGGFDWLYSGSPSATVGDEMLVP